jgi:hypothetical protein
LQEGEKLYVIIVMDDTITFGFPPSVSHNKPDLIFRDLSALFLILFFRDGFLSAGIHAGIALHTFIGVDMIFAVICF